MVILGDVSPNGRHLGFSLMIFTFALSAVILIMIPKWMAFYGLNVGDKPKRGARPASGVAISGMPTSAEQSAAQERSKMSSQLNGSHPNSQMSEE